MHIWWECPDINSFWNKIFSLHNQVTSSSIACVPEIGLLSLIPGPLNLSKKGLLRHFLPAARQTIAAPWKQLGKPPIAAFLEKINYVMRMEELTASDDKSPVFFHIWQPYLDPV